MNLKIVEKELRPLWPMAEKNYSISPLFYLALPEGIEGSLDFFCKRVTELGFNAIVLGSLEEVREPSSSFSLEMLAHLCKKIRGYGLKIIFAPSYKKNKSTCPFDPQFRLELQEDFVLMRDLFKEIDYFFWSSLHLEENFEAHEEALDYTHFEMIIKEANTLEESLVPLIFYLPLASGYEEVVSSWMKKLLDQVKVETILSFSALKKGIFAGDLELHPFFDERVSKENPTKLLPIVNSGSIQRGEGLWPILGLNLLETVISFINEPHFCGFISLTPTIPLQTSLLDCSLWIASKVLCHGEAPRKNLRKWLKNFRPNWEIGCAEEALREAENILKNFYYVKENKRELSQEKLRALVDSLAASLHFLQNLALRVDDEEREGLSFYHYVALFLIDLKRLILSLGINSNLFPSNLLGDAQNTLWSTPTTFLKRPYYDEDNIAIKSIYKESLHLIFK